MITGKGIPETEDSNSFGIPFHLNTTYVTATKKSGSCTRP